jgi:outer membrane protein assembly factor BamA
VHTPRFALGRLVFDALLLRRYRNYLNKLTELGGEGRLRGYTTGEFIGQDVLAANLELRTRPVEIWSVQLAGAAFFDVGDAFEGFEDLRIKQSAGFGVRFLFPQLGRTVMRADWGFPLTRGYMERDSFPGDIVLTFRQAFAMPAPLLSTQ